MKRIRSKMVWATSLGLLTLTLTGCRIFFGNSIEGTYSNENGSMILELRSGSEAALTLLGEGMTCSYETTDQNVTITCPEEDAPLELTIHDDGSLSGGAFVGVLRKSE